jgi:hypothetical protein
MSCFEPSGYKWEEIDGECPDCGEPTVDGDAYYKCGYSSVICETCNCAPCDLSC